MSNTPKAASEIQFRDSWRVESSHTVPKFEDDGSLYINDDIGFLHLPDDYRDFIARYPGGVTPTGDDNFILAHFEDEPVAVALEYLISLKDVLSDYSTGYISTFVNGSQSRLPAKHIIIASGEIDDFVLNVDLQSSDYGKVTNWTRAGDPWGTGDNTEGLAWVADSFTELMDGLAEE